MTKPAPTKPSRKRDNANISKLVAAAKKASKIVVLDHHISAQKEFERYKKHSPIPNNLEIKFVQEL